MMKLHKLLGAAGASALLLSLPGCGGDSSSSAAPVGGGSPPPAVVADPQVWFDIEVLNLTAGQPLSPPVVVLHGGSYRAWHAGQPASGALEVLAESGDASGFGDLDGVNTLVRFSEMVRPGESVSFAVAIDEGAVAEASLVTMLVNTNDAFTGFTGFDLASVEGSQTWRLRAYDAGTEANTELAATVPGLTGGPAGYDSARDDVDFVHVHAGVLSVHDMHTSALAAGNRFDNPVAQVTVTRRS